MRIIEQGHTDSADTTSLYVPSLALVVAGDAGYNQCHMYVGDTTPEPEELGLGVGPVGGARAHDCCCRSQARRARLAVGHRGYKRYLLDFDRLQKTAASDEELFNSMTELYPHWVANQSWLMFRIPGGITHIDRGGHILAYFGGRAGSYSGRRIRFQRGETQ